MGVVREGFSEEGHLHQDLNDEETAVQRSGKNSSQSQGPEAGGRDGSADGMAGRDWRRDSQPTCPHLSPGHPAHFVPPSAFLWRTLSSLAACSSPERLLGPQKPTREAFFSPWERQRPGQVHPEPHSGCRRRGWAQPADRGRPVPSLSTESPGLGSGGEFQ